MFPIYHFITTIPLVIILCPFYGWKVLIMLIAGVFVDIDHYLFYIFETKNFSPFKFYKFHKKLHKEKNFELVEKDLYFFHTIEFIFISSVASIFSDTLFLAWIAMVLHRLTDFMYTKFLLKSWSFAPIFIIEWFYKKQKSSLNAC